MKEESYKVKLFSEDGKTEYDITVNKTGKKSNNTKYQLYIKLSKYDIISFTLLTILLLVALFFIWIGNTSIAVGAAFVSLSILLAPIFNFIFSKHSSTQSFGPLVISIVLGIGLTALYIGFFIPGGKLPKALYPENIGNILTILAILICDIDTLLRDCFR